MCTLCLSDMGELRDDWLREPRKLAVPVAGDKVTSSAPPASTWVAPGKLATAKTPPAIAGVPA